MIIHTARIGYKPKGNKVILDITIKNNPLCVLSPTWKMVKDFKNHKISWYDYKKKYYKLMTERYKTREKEFRNILNIPENHILVLVCFCRDKNKCHRTLAKKILDSLLF